MSLYQFFLFLHILAVVIWIGGGAILELLAFRAQRTGDPEVMAAVAADAEWVGMRVFMPSSILVLAAGIALVNTGHFGFDELWIQLGLVGIVASAVTGAAFLGPESGRIKTLTAQGADRATIDAKIGRVLLVSRIELVVLIAIILDMVLKPGS